MDREDTAASSDQGDRNRVLEASHSRVMRGRNRAPRSSSTHEANNCAYGSGLCEKLSDTIEDKKFPRGDGRDANHEARDLPE